MKRLILAAGTALALMGAASASCEQPDEWQLQNHRCYTNEFGNSVHAPSYSYGEPPRIFLLDIKDWHGRIDSKDGRWYLDGKDRDNSPIEKVNGIAREIAIKLGNALKRRPEAKSAPVPRLEGLVVLTGKADRSGISELEKKKVFTAEEFIKAVTDKKKERETFGDTKPQILGQPLTEAFWKGHLFKFSMRGQTRHSGQAIAAFRAT